MTTGGLGQTQDGRVGATTKPPQRVVLMVFMSSGIREFDLSVASTLVIGRSPSSPICLDHPSVSREHARIVGGTNTLRIEDLDSRNGTMVNDTRVGPEGASITVGDRLRFGEIESQLQAIREVRSGGAKLIIGAEFDSRVDEEMERGVRFRRPFALICIEVSDTPGSALELARRKVTQTLRLIDVVTLRGTGRLDALLPECTKDEAVQVAKRMHEMLSTDKGVACMGVASFPDDGGSPQALLLAAQGAMRAGKRGVHAAASAVRTLSVGGHEIVVADPAMVNIFALVDRIAPGTVPVLIEGETGVGKEMLVEAIHALGPRAGARLVKVNCAAIPEALLEGELFGYERGAFSGATSAKPGLIEEAQDGTLFLDEIGDMPGPLQAKLLRVLEDQRVRRLGAVRDRQVDLRLVTATHRDLRQLVQAGDFRQDLYYRLKGFGVRLPPLRERRREIILLAERFAATSCRANRRPEFRISPETRSCLLAYSWPGNVRELRHVIEHAVLLCDGPAIEPQHLPAEVIEFRETPDSSSSSSSSSPLTIDRIRPLDEAVRAYESQCIRDALAATSGNQTKAAELLRIPRRTLVSKIATLGIERQRERRQRRDS